jgi:hypothetical protein
LERAEEVKGFLTGRTVEELAELIGESVDRINYLFDFLPIAEVVAEVNKDRTEAKKIVTEDVYEAVMATPCPELDAEDQEQFEWCIACGLSEELARRYTITARRAEEYFEAMER